MTNIYVLYKMTPYKVKCIILLCELRTSYINSCPFLINIPMKNMTNTA